ncbi:MULTISPECIES: RagB/SusD family nutrient uptake outer membrane protein [unclassified Maribacter]|uniref:RagB/SusD family nutrient uptake outer membrane protein n=3 Tax=Maribacter TaxID=252356 RepID=UPI00257EF30D|nr:MULTISPECIES: RagB/SusD family nutrient uptake outer membrane protein [unclassified Maribacter]|tara:strand:+ start:60701 stop:62437 length:1737 start_codon:yes stop_codon:yes gene_type:complete
MKNFIQYFLLFFVLYSCSDDNTISEIEEIDSGNIEVTVLLGSDAAIGAVVTTNPETRTLVVGESGVVVFETIDTGNYVVNVVLNQNPDFLYFQEVVLTNNVTEKIVFKIPEIPELTEQDLDIDFLLNVSYNNLRSIFNADAYLSYWGDTGTDILKANPNFNGGLVDLDAYSFNAQSTVINQVWAEHYIQIRGLNLGIDYLLDSSNIVSSEIDRKELEAHFKFLRSLLYFNLIRIYGNPLLSVTAEIDLSGPPNYPQNPSTTYSQIEEDLLYAIENLPVLNSNDQANQWSARFLLAKVYMTMAGFPLNEYGKYGSALEQLKILQGQYELMADYNSVFNEENEDSNREILFKITFDGSEDSKSSFNDYWGPLGIASEDALLIVSGFENSFNSSMSFENPVSFPIEIEDNRFKNNIATFSISGNNVVNQVDPKNWRPLKWYNGELPDADFESTSFDYPVFRYADVLLLLAEAENEVNGPTPLAYAAINQVRERAFGNENNVPGNLNKDQFFDVIYLERKLELCFEGHRRDDLVRWNKLQEVIDGFNSTNDFSKDYQPHEYVWPIPQSEIDLNPNAVQNPGY